jgi:hypothetical protein
MFPASILQGTYNQSSGSGSGIDPITAPGTGTVLGHYVQNGNFVDLIITSSNNQTPIEAKRLYATSESPDISTGLYAYFSGSLQVGTVLYSGSSQATTFAGAYTSGYMTNDYAHFAMKPDGGAWGGSQPDPSNFYWITIQKSNSTVTAITENVNVTTNVLKDVGTNTNGLPNSSYGGFVLNNSAYNSHTAALAASLTSSQNLATFYDGPGNYPKTHDRVYVANTGQQSFAALIWGGIGWHPFTKTGSSIDYAVQMGYASTSGANSNTLPRAQNSDLWISEIRNSSGNIVTEIT